jgi:hypothetical protein
MQQRVFHHTESHWQQASYSAAAIQRPKPLEADTFELISKFRILGE